MPTSKCEQFLDETPVRSATVMPAEERGVVQGAAAHLLNAMDDLRDAIWKCLAHALEKHVLHMARQA